MPDFHRIGARILFLAGSVVVIGLTAVILLYTARQERSLIEQNEGAVIKVTHSVAEGLQAVMLKGYADLAHELAMRLRKLDGVVDYRILRGDGREAFVDNATIDQVNRRVGYKKFSPRSGVATARLAVPADSPSLRKLQDTQTRQLYYETLPDGERQLTVLEPVRYEESCHDCHDDGSAVRGIVKLTTSMQPIASEVRMTWAMSFLVLALGSVLILLAVYVIAQRAVVLPIRRVTQAMAVVAQGDLSASVPVVGRDEIGQMAASFNQMSARLLDLYMGLQDEQNKLTTIILGAREGIVVTDSAGLVVLVNPAASELLGKSEHRIREEGLIQIVDDAAWMEWQLAIGEERFGSDQGDVPATYEYQGRTLAIYASIIRTGAGSVTGSAAMIRDVTEEKRLTKELDRLAHTDPLTGLFNRRRFDQVMDAEFDRGRRYGTKFSLLLLDIDRFKGFNDRYGHDCGDRVLKALAIELGRHVGPQGVVCRYGGEELAVVLPESAGDAAVRLAEILRQGVETLRVDGLQVTVSIGVATNRPETLAVSELISAADAALYRAKAAGRNVVVEAEV